MPLERFSNLASTTLTSGVGSGSTTLPVASVSEFPTLTSGDQYRLTIGKGESAEIVIVTAPPSGLNVPVTRGAENTTAQAWPSGTPVTMTLTAGALNAMLGCGVKFVTNSTPGVLDATNQLALVDSTTGPTSVSTTLVPVGGFVTVRDVGNDASSNTITCSFNSHQIEDPQNLGTFVSSLSLTTNSIAVTWRFDGTRFVVVSSSLPSGGSGGSKLWYDSVSFRDVSTGVVGTGSGTGNALYLVDSSAGATSALVNMGAAKVLTIRNLFPNSSHAITVIPNNGISVEDPSSLGTFVAATPPFITFPSGVLQVSWFFDPTTNLAYVIDLEPMPSGISSAGEFFGPWFTATPPPVASTWTHTSNFSQQTNQKGPPVATDVSGGLNLSVPGSDGVGSTALFFQGLEKTLSASTFTVTAGFLITLGDSYAAAGLYLHVTGGTGDSYATAGPVAEGSGGVKWEVDTWTALNGRDSTVTPGAPAGEYPVLIRFKVAPDSNPSNSRADCSYSTDGVNFVPLLTLAGSVFTGGPAATWHAGIFGQPYSSATDVNKGVSSITCFHWAVSYP